MELKNLESLKDEIAYLEEAEELLQAIRYCFDHYELCRILREKYYKEQIKKKNELKKRLRKQLKNSRTKLDQTMTDYEMYHLLLGLLFILLIIHCWHTFS